MPGEIRLGRSGALEGLMKPLRIHAETIIPLLTSIRIMLSAQCDPDKWVRFKGRPSVGHPQLSSSPYPDDRSGCRYILDGDARPRCCGVGRRPGSSYCPEHHALCHLAGGTVAEAKRLREVEALATAVGGRRGSDGAGPPRRFLRKLEQAIRAFS